MERGADVAAKDHDEETVIHWVAKNGHEAVMQLLQEKGPEVATKVNHIYFYGVRHTMTTH